MAKHGEDVNVASLERLAALGVRHSVMALVSRLIGLCRMPKFGVGASALASELFTAGGFKFQDTMEKTGRVIKVEGRKRRRRVGSVQERKGKHRKGWRSKAGKEAHRAAMRRYWAERKASKAATAARLAEVAAVPVSVPAEDGEVRS